MIIKTAFICCMTFMQLIIGSRSENPVKEIARVGKFFGWLSVEHSNDAPLKLFVNTNWKWKGELGLTFGRRPLIASAELFYYVDKHKQQQQQQQPVPVEHNIVLQSDSMSGTYNDSDPLSATSETVMHRDATEQTPLYTTEEATKVTARALKLEDYDDITFNPDADANRVKREAFQIERVDRSALKTGDVSEDEMDSTTVESSTVAMKMHQQDSSEINFVTISPEAEASSELNVVYVTTPTSSYFPYPSSKNPSADSVAITYSPHHKPDLPALDFFPSQPDYYQHSFTPYCINSIYRKHTPAVHDDAWANYRKWK